METMMTHPATYDEFDRHAAIALFGDECEARILCDGQWVIWRDRVLCFADLGDSQSNSHFTSGGTFSWVADKPYQVSDNNLTHFVPAEVVGKEGLNREIWLFARPSLVEPYRFIGQLQSSHMQKMGSNDNHGEAHFELRPTLSSEVWAQLGGFEPGDLDHAAVDRALAALAFSNETAVRLDVLRTLVRFWHGEIQSGDGFTDDELASIQLPTVLRWWYRFAGRRKEIVSGQNSLLSPTKLEKTSDGLLVFYGENQWCYEWATSLDGDDPPVYGREGAPENWEPEGITLSEHLILACLFEGTMCHCRYGASASWLDANTVAQIVEQIPPVAITPWHWCEETRFYAKDGAFMLIMNNGENNGTKGYSVWVGAKTEKPLQFLKLFLDEAWDYVAI
jgi:hypothetical protein